MATQNDPARAGKTPIDPAQQRKPQEPQQQQQQARPLQRQSAPGGRSMARGGLASSSPFSFMRRFMEDMDQLFDDFGFGGLASSGAMQSIWSPQIEMFEREGQLVVRADLPGLEENDVRVHLEEDALVIEGERRDEQEDKREGFYHSERSYGSFQRVVPLPSNVDPESINASFQHGVLEVTMPLPKAAPRGRKIEIRSGSAATPQPGAAGKGRPS